MGHFVCAGVLLLLTGLSTHVQLSPSCLTADGGGPTHQQEVVMLKIVPGPPHPRSLEDTLCTLHRGPSGRARPAQITGHDPDDGVDPRSRIAARAARIGVDPGADAGAAAGTALDPGRPCSPARPAPTGAAFHL